MLRIVDAGLPAQNRPQVVARMMDGTCPIREHAGDGGFVGRCDYPLHDHIYCPRHGRITDYPTLDDREVPVHQRNHMDPETPMLIKPYLLIAIAVAIGLTILIYTSIALFSTDERSTTYAADGAVATLAQIIPPAPYPTLGTAQARLRQSLEASCRKTNMKVTIDVGGIPLTVKTGKCMHVMGVPVLRVGAGRRVLPVPVPDHHHGVAPRLRVHQEGRDGRAEGVPVGPVLPVKIRVMP
jgi:hypothetical protein